MGLQQVHGVILNTLKITVMDIKGMLISVATVAVGYAVGLMVYNKFLGGTSMKVVAPPTETSEEGK